MGSSQKKDYIFYQGAKYQVEFYYNESGKMPAKNYLEGTPFKVKVKLAALVKYMAERGKLFDKTKFRVVDSKEKIYEFKPLDHRFFSFFYKDAKIIIISAYMKKSQKVSKKDLDKAKVLKKDYIRRVKGGVYYEKS
jgi:phage-related protein